MALDFSAGAAGRFCVVDGWGAGDGLLPESAVIAATRTRDGYLWLGTLNGLVRFDGVHFTVFDESSTPELASIQTVRLFEDRPGNLWIGTESAGVMLVTNGQVFNLPIGKDRRDGTLASICQDSQGAVWMLTKDRALARYWHGDVDVWEVPGNTPLFGRPNFGRSVIAEKSGMLWVGTDNALFGLDPAAVRSKASLPQMATVMVGQLDFLLASRGGGYWRIADNRVVKCDGPAVQKDLGPCPWAAGPDMVKAACEDHAGNLIVGTRQGVFWFEAGGGAARICVTNGLANDFVLSLAVDDTDNLWVGMNGGGPSGHPLNRVIRSMFDLVPATAGQDIQSISADRDGRVWYSPKGQDICYWSNGLVTSVSSAYGSFSQLSPSAVMVDSNQDVWASTVGARLFHWDGGLFRPVAGDDAVSPFIHALAPGPGGRLWAGTESGLSRWDGTNWATYTTHDGLTGNIIRAIAEDAAGGVWVGTEHGGLDYMQSNKVSVFQKSTGFPSDNISCLFFDHEGVLWVGTGGAGLVRMAGGQWRHFAKEDGLAGNSIDFIIEDDQGYLWLGANIGLMRVKKSELDAGGGPAGAGLSCRLFDSRDGLPANECTQGSQPAASRTADGRLWFSTIGGMVSINPAEIHNAGNAPAVVIESVSLDEKAQGGRGLRVAAPTEVSVPAGNENLEIHFTSLDLGGAGRSLFRYRMDGANSEPGRWTIAGRDRFARFLKLRPGHYRFEVQASREDGSWGEAATGLDVQVLPPFWEKWWFRLVAVVCTLAIVAAIVHWVSTQRLQRELAALRAQEAIEKERARIARDIHDQVGASLTQLSLLADMAQADKDKPDEVENHARQISQSARNTAHELDEIVWTVNPSNDTLEGLVNYICKHAQEYLAVAGVRYRLDVPPNLPAIPISPEMRHNVFLAAKESVTNVVRHARAQEARLRLYLEADRFTFEIEDNGRGPGGTTSAAAGSRNGLRNMRKRMEDVGGEFHIGPGRQGGTLVRLTAPLRNRPA